MGNKDVGKLYGFGSENRTKEFDDEARSKAKGVPKKRKWTKEYCVEQLEFILDSLKEILIDAKKTETNDKKLKRENIRDLNTMTNRVLDYLRYLYPPTQQNLNLNVNLFDDQLGKWRKEREAIVEIMEGGKDGV